MTNVSYIILGFATDENGPGQPFCVLSWLGNTVSSRGLDMRVSKNWQKMIVDRYSAYASELIEDWSKLRIDDPNALIQMLKELSVGPVRTLEVGSASRAAFNDLLLKNLGRDATSVPQE